jgi:hypothetical protein
VLGSRLAVRVGWPATVATATESPLVAGLIPARALCDNLPDACEALSK